MRTPLSDKEAQLQYPEHPKVYPYLKRYGLTRPDFLFAAQNLRIQSRIDRMPMNWRSAQLRANRCRWWKGSSRKWDQDVLNIRSRTYPVLEVLWELTFGPLGSAPVGPEGRKIVARPICSHYRKIGVCCNPWHLKLCLAGAGSRRTDPQTIRDVRDLWRSRQISAREAAQIYGLTERRVYEIVAGVARS